MCSSGEPVWLDLSGNALDGSFPSEMGLLTLLTGAFDIFFNGITGSIPSQLGALTGLSQFFNLFANSMVAICPALAAQAPLTFTSPANLHGSQSLSLTFHGGGAGSVNWLCKSGSVPSQLGALESLTTSFHLNENAFCGSIPTQVTALSTQVTSMWDVITGNHLGPTPCSSTSAVRFLPSLRVRLVRPTSPPVTTLALRPAPRPRRFRASTPPRRVRAGRIITTG